MTALYRTTIVQRGRRLEYFTIAWNALEGLVAVVAGVVARSISLVGFGIDSFIEVTSGSTLLWRMSVDVDVPRRERNERRSLKIVGVCFLSLAAYITYESIMDLWSKRSPEHSVPTRASASWGPDPCWWWRRARRLPPASPTFRCRTRAGQVPVYPPFTSARGFFGCSGFCPAAEICS